MIKVSVLYPNASDVKFDMAYYLDRHMPMVRDLLGSALKGMTVEQGLAGGQPGAAAPYVALCHLSFDSVDAFQSAFDKHRRAFQCTDPAEAGLVVKHPKSDPAAVMWGLAGTYERDTAEEKP